MFRFLVALLLLGGVLVGYDRVMAVEVEDGGDALSQDLGLERVPEPAQDAAEAEAVTPAPIVASEPTEEQAPPALQTPAKADAQVEAALKGLRSGDASAASAAFRVGLKRADSAGARLLAEFASEFAEAPADAAVAMLGPDNGFLHAEKGRAMARQAIEKARALPPEDSVRALTRMIETCMKGRMTKEQTEARAVVDEAYQALKPQLMRTVLNPAHLARARSYKVEPGDALSRIARRFRDQGHKVEAGTIAAFNRIRDPKRLQVGQVLKIPIEPIRTVVEKGSFLQAVYVGDVIFRLYWVGHGKDDCTPLATFTIGTKQENPDWYADGRVIPYGHPDNVLGDYFVKFLHSSFTGFGVHGTAEPESVGTMASAGCIRMLDDDIEDYFKLVPRGTEFEIRDTIAR